MSGEVKVKMKELNKARQMRVKAIDTYRLAVLKLLPKGYRLEYNALAEEYYILDDKGREVFL